MCCVWHAHWFARSVHGCVQEGLGNVFLIGANTVVQKAKIEASMPRKRGAAAAGFDKALNSFFDKLMQVTMRPQVACCNTAHRSDALSLHDTAA